MFSLEPQPQLGERVHRVLLESIVNQILEPGQHLVIDDLASKVGTSGTPIREALNRLQQEGLVTKIPYQGWRVREFTIGEITEIYEIRAALEGLAVGLCCTKKLKPRQDMLKQLMELQKEGTEFARKSDLVRYRDYNDAFHAIILEAAGNQTLHDIMNTLKNRIRLFSEKTIRFPGRPPKALKEHATLIEYVGAGERAKAVSLMEQHILSALGDLLSTMKEL